VKSALLAIPAILGCSALSACGSSDGPVSGFEPPDVTVTSYDLQGAEVAADWSCLGTPTDEVPLAVDVTVSGVVYEIFSDQTVADIEVSGFAGTSWDAPFASDVSAADGAYTLTAPTGTSGFGMRVTGDDRLTGYRLGVGLDPNVAEQEVDVETSTLDDAAGIAGSVGVVRTPGRGLVVGGLQDCQGNVVGGVIATVSSSAGEPAHVKGVSTYYFDETYTPQLPADQPYTSSLGVFLIVELPPTSAPSWLQAWGFVDEDSLAAGDLTLLGEARIPMVADSAVSAALAPLRTE